MLDGKNDRDTQMSLAEVYEKGRRWNDMVRAMHRIPVPRAHGVLSAAFVLDVLKYKLW